MRKSYKLWRQTSNKLANFRKNIQTGDTFLALQIVQGNCLADEKITLTKQWIWFQNSKCFQKLISRELPLADKAENTYLQQVGHAKSIRPSSVQLVQSY